MKLHWIAAAIGLIHFIPYRIADEPKSRLPKQVPAPVVPAPAK